MISVVMIVRNEEKNLKDCLETVRWADEIIIVDSGSTDRTLEIVKQYTSKVFQEPFQNFSAQKNAALSHATGDWIFVIDADERVSPELAFEICEKARQDHERGGEAIYAVKRLTYFFGKLLNFSGTQEDYPIRLFPRAKVRYEQPVHERIVSELPVKSLRGVLYHLSTRDRAHYQEKLDCYIPLELETMRLHGRKGSWVDVFVRPPMKFFYLYFWQKGFLDGIPGLQYAILSSYYDFLKWSRFIKR